MCIKSIFIAFAVSFSVHCFGISLHQDEAVVLEQFFRTMLLESEGGYVLYNKKPVCINGFNAIDNFYGENPRHKAAVDLREGAKVWNKTAKPNHENIIIHVYNGEDSLAKNSVHILFINKKLFLETVKENLPLFQYVLGPSTTPQQLLTKLITPDETFHSVLKNDTVLIGILLGYGTQNSLYGSRIERLQDHLVSNEQLPQKNVLLQNVAMSEMFKEVFLLHRPSVSPQLQPSFSYSSIYEEMSDLTKKMEISSPQLAQKRPPFIFGKLKDDNETTSLIPVLEKTQTDINALLSSKDFLNRVVHLIFPNVNLELIQTKSSTYTLDFTASERKLLPSMVGMGIQNILDDKNDDYKKGFILGMKDAQTNTKPRFNGQSADSYDKLIALSTAQNNIKQADLFFSKLDKDKDLTCKSPKKLYYRSLEKGLGTELSNQAKVTFHCKIETPNDQVLIDTWANNQPMEINLNDVIPGFALGMQGMKVGEIRVLFIHPCVGYGIYTLLEKGIYLKAFVKLIAIHNSGKYVPFAPLSSCDFDKDLSALNNSNLADVSKEAGYLQGYDVWNHYKQASYYTLEQILNSMDSHKSKTDGIIYESTPNQDLLNRLHWNIYHLKLLDKRI